MKHIILHLFPGTKLQIIFFNDSLFYTFTLINLKKMRNLILCLLFLLPLTSSGQTAFDEYFTDKTLRFDFMLAGNSSETKVFPASLREEPFWGGSLTKLTDEFGYGNFRYEVFDAASGKLIYSKGFCTLYQEWQSTAEAKKIDRSFYEVATFPISQKESKFCTQHPWPRRHLQKAVRDSHRPCELFHSQGKTFIGGCNQDNRYRRSTHFTRYHIYCRRLYESRNGQIQSRR